MNPNKRTRCNRLRNSTVLAAWLTLASAVPAAEGFFHVEQRNGKWFVEASDDFNRAERPGSASHP